MTRFWRTLCLLVLGLALGLGQPLRALAAPVALAQDQAAMPCHGEMAAPQAAEPTPEAPSCPHCSHGQIGWGCGHCAGCLLGAALALQSAQALPLIAAGNDGWTAFADAAARPLALAVPTPPPKALSAIR